MYNPRLLGILVILSLCVPCFAQDEEAPTGFELVFGPRVGVSYMIESPEEFSLLVQKLYPAGDYFPVFTLFGVTLEQRILLGQTKSHFAFQELVLLAGLEQGICLPEGAVLIGYRDYSGLEFGIGPIIGLSGLGVVAALGWTISFHGVYVPIDVSFRFPSGDRASTLALTTGFNFKRRTR